MSYMQNTIERKTPTYLSLYVDSMSSNASAVVDKESPHRTIIELKRLLVDGVDQHRVVVASVAESSGFNKRKSRAKCNAAKSDACAARSKLVHGNEANCCAGTGKPVSPSTSSMTSKTVNKTMPSPIKESSVKSNSMQCDCNDFDDSLCDRATAATADDDDDEDDDDDDSNNEENAEQKEDSEDDTVERDHGPSFFHLHCGCEECLEYREMLIQLMVEDHEYNILWDRLKALIREFYEVVPQNPVPYEGSMDERYESMMQKQARWFNDGHMDYQKNIQLSLSSHLPLSNEMTFVLVFSMLYTRDPHQLFELLCIQLRCIAVAYSEGVKKLITTDADGKNPKYDPIQLLDVILDGYDKFCSTASKLSTLLFELQRDHLQKFSLTWQLLNKRMYQRWVYLEVQDLIPECILTLKDLLDSEDYSAMAHRLIRFDEDMTSITQSWIEVWSLLQNYYLEREEYSRRLRISYLEEMLKMIRKTYFGRLNRTVPMSKWMEMGNRQEAWLQMIDYLKNVWDEKDDSRLFIQVLNDNCVKCQFELASHYIDCECVTCSLAGGPNQRRDSSESRAADTHCVKCAFYEQLDLDYLNYVKRDLGRALTTLTCPGFEASEDDSDNDIDDIWKTNHSYHLAWAVFKHLPDRKAYSALKFDPRHFCMFQEPPCPRTECRVATHIIAGLFPLNFSKFLIKAYHPVYIMQQFHDEIKNFDPKTKDLKMDGSGYPMPCGAGSAFAECYLIDAPIPVQEILYSCFVVDNNDIELNIYWLECIHMFRTNENSPFKKLEDDPRVREVELRLQMEHFGMDGPELRAEMTNRERKLLSVLIMSPETKGIAEALGWTDSDKKHDVMPFVKTSKSSARPAKSDAFKANSGTVSSTVSKQSTYMSEKSAANVSEIDVIIEKKSEKCVVTPPSIVKPKAIATSAAAGAATASDKDEPLTDAVKIAVKQKLNQKLEAELKVLKKEHSSVLKEMVRDLEQIKENGESQLIAKKDKCSSHANANGQHCCADHSDMMDNHANHTKICHRGDGQCTCYYCTIFGHAECNHGRMNETRDRLRKRLHQIHSKSSNKSHNTKNIKNQPGINLKKLLATASNGNGNSNGSGGGATCAANSAKSITKSVAEQKENNANETLEEAFKAKTNSGAAQRTVVDHSKNGQKVVNQQRPISAATTANAPRKPISVSALCASATNNATNTTSDAKNTIKKRKLLNVNQHYQNLYECDYGLCSSCDEHRTKEKPPRAVPAAQSTRPHGILPSQLPPETLATVRRASFCPVNSHETPSLDDILDFIEGNTTSKKDSHKKAAKKAKQKQKKEDVKKIEELEQSRNEFYDIYFKEFDAKNELKTLKSVKKRDKKRIAEMEGTVKKYGKFKAKIESTILELISGLKKNNAEFKFAYLPTKEQQQEWQLQQEEKQRPSPSVMQMQNNGSAAESGTASASANDGNVQPSNGESASDQSKRMVTIRRINLPHSEPQVTVTAKGASPDKDKLLYTFINGQLIPGATPANGGSAAAPPKPDKKSKSDGKQPQSIETNAKGKNNKKTNQPIQPVAEVAKKGGKDKTKINGKQSPDTNERVTLNKTEAGKKVAAVPIAPGTTVTDKKKQKGKKNAVDSDIDSITNATKEMTLAAPEVKPKKEKRKVRAMKFEYADPNYKVNQFDLLDMDEDDEYYTESSSSSSDEEEPPRVTKPAAVINPKPVRNAPPPVESTATKKAAINNKGNAITSDKKAVTQSQPEPMVAATSKKQKKKAAQPQQQTQNDKAASKSLTNQMQRLQLNADTTIELVNDNHHSSHGQMPPNVSIMDQLNRGVKVEGLMLPPGITLTRVDPNTAEGLRAKKESIGRLSHPAPQQYQQPQDYQRPPPAFINVNVPMPPIPTNVNGDASKKLKAKKKKNKKSGDAPPDAAANPNQNKIVTLRNPLFQQAAPPNDTRSSGMHAQPAYQRNQMPAMNVNQHASIIKNENGMFTIRNPALHQQLTNTVNTQYRPYASELFPHEVKPDNFSYFSENVNPLATGRLPNAPSYAQPIPMPPSSKISHHQQQKSTQAIGSEIKSAHQIKNMPWYPVNQQQQQPKQPTQNGDIFTNLSHLNPQRSYSPFDASTNYGFNSDFIGASPTPHIVSASNSTSATGAGAAPQNQYYNGAYSSYNTAATDSDSLFSSSGTGGGGGASTCSNGFYKSYDDNSFLNSLHPGQRLNSEVTIHNIGDAKFGRDQATGNLNDGVEITRVNGPMPGNIGGSYGLGANRAVGSHRQPLADTKSDLTATNSTEFGDSVFVPNQSVNLSELESEERDIESFKRFNWYFEPPKNKPKINFNVKDIVLTKKQPASDNSSPYFGDLASSSLCNTPPPHPDEEYHTHASSVSLPSSSHDSNAPKASHCDPLRASAPTANVDNFLHGIIGDDLKADRV